MLTEEDAQCLYGAMTEIHDKYMNMAGFFRDSHGNWIGAKGVGEQSYTSNANGVYAARSMLGILMKAKGLTPHRTTGG